MSKVQGPKSLLIALVAFAALACGAQPWTNLSPLAQRSFLSPAVPAMPQPPQFPQKQAKETKMEPVLPASFSLLPSVQTSGIKLSAVTPFTNLTYVVPWQSLLTLNWTITDITTISVNIYAGLDVDDPFLMFNVPCGNIATFFCSLPEPFEVWATALDSAGDESDPSNVLIFVPPPPVTNIVLSWSPPRTNVWIEASSNLLDWVWLTNLDGSNVVLSITNAPFQFFDAVTTGTPPITLQAKPQ